MKTEAIRQQMRQRRAKVSEADLGVAAQNLCARIVELPAYQQAQRIAAYFAVNGEISLHSVIDIALAQDKEIYLPNLDQKALRFSPYFHEQKMRMNRYRLPEPDVSDDAMLAPDALDLVLLPLVAFDAQRNRVGMGGGYYDRSFAFRQNPDITSPVLIGVAHELQKVECLVPESWDVRLDLIVTDQRVYA